MTGGELGLYLSAGFILLGALCWLACTVLAWWFRPKDPRPPSMPKPGQYWFNDSDGWTYCYTGKTWEKSYKGMPLGEKLEPDYLQDCEWPATPKFEFYETHIVKKGDQ